MPVDPSFLRHHSTLFLTSFVSRVIILKDIAIRERRLRHGLTLTHHRVYEDARHHLSSVVVITRVQLPLHMFPQKQCGMALLCSLRTAV